MIFKTKKQNIRREFKCLSSAQHTSNPNSNWDHKQTKTHTTHSASSFPPLSFSFTCSSCLELLQSTVKLFPLRFHRIHWCCGFQWFYPTTATSVAMASTNTTKRPHEEMMTQSWRFIFILWSAASNKSYLEWKKLKLWYCEMKTAQSDHEVMDIYNKFIKIER